MHGYHDSSTEALGSSCCLEDAVRREDTPHKEERWALGGRDSSWSSWMPFEDVPARDQSCSHGKEGKRAGQDGVRIDVTSLQPFRGTQYTFVVENSTKCRKANSITAVSAQNSMLVHTVPPCTLLFTPVHTVDGLVHHSGIVLPSVKGRVPGYLQNHARPSLL